jgi:hypothetical protein
MCSRFSSSVGLAAASLVWLLAGSLGTAASAQSLTASLATDRGCGASAVYNIGEPNQILFSVSQNASVTLRLQRPDGSVSTFLANQPLVGGVTYSINGVIGNPPGQRLLTLDAVAGAQTAHMECTYTAQAVTNALAVTLQTDRGCGATALYNIGESITFSFSASQNAQVTLQLQRPDGTTSVLLANQPVQGGVTQTLLGIIGNPPGQRRLILDAVAGSQTAHAECTYTAQAVTSALTVSLTTNRGCGAGAVFNIGEPITFSYSASQNAQVTLRLQRPDGTTSVLVANQPVQGGVTQTFQGIIGNPTGQRTLILDAVAGSQTAHAECTYTAQSIGGVVVLNLSIDQGCGATYHVGQGIRINFSASANTTLTLVNQRADGTQQILFANQPVLAGQTYSLTGIVGSQLGGRTLILTASPGASATPATCQFTVVP